MDTSLISYIISTSKLIPAIVKTMTSRSDKRNRFLCLRALSAVCCSGEVLGELETCGGVDAVAGLLVTSHQDPDIQVKKKLYCI